MQLAPRQVTVLGCGKGDHWLDRMLGRKPDGGGNTLDKAGKLLQRKILPLASNSMLASNWIKLTHALTVDQTCNKIKSKHIVTTELDHGNCDFQFKTEFVGIQQKCFGLC